MMCYDLSMIRHSVDGRRAHTIEDLADALELDPSHVRTIIARENHDRAVRGEKAIPIMGECGRKSLYDLAVIQKIVATRPGKGSPGQPRPNRAKDRRLRRDQE